MKPVVKTKPALLEIGFEEMPARFMPAAMAQISEKLSQSLTTSGIQFSKIDVFGTPRRLAVLVHGLSPRSSDREDMAVGPPPKAAKDESGAWTQAATGFAKAQKIRVEQLQLRQTPKGERYVAIHFIKGQKTEAVLKELFPALIQSLTFPKSMIWDSPDFRFARPVRWIVALYNSTLIKFRLSKLFSEKMSVGLLSLGGHRVPIGSAEKYKSVLQGRCVLVDPEERKKNIRNQLESIAKRIKGHVVMDDDHLSEVAFLTEYPVSILGHFPEPYLKLPREVLVVVLKKHQKFFPLESAKGQLTNSFIGVRNGPSESQEEVREGYERVINARFSDAQFFYEKDSSKPLDLLVPALSGIGFHEKLGSMLDKTNRVRTLAERYAEHLNWNEADKALVERTSKLCKADLLTQMVGELPELQGIAGRFYSDKTEPAEVSQGIEQHYWPLTAEGKLPTSHIAALVSIADKMDTLAANFLVGLVPTGSADPYGLRRMAVGVMRILMERQWEVSLDRLINLAFEGLSSMSGPVTNQKKDLALFFAQRCDNWFGHQGYRQDEIDAVLSGSDQSLSMIREKLAGLKAVRGKQEFDSLANAIKRARNILTQASQKGLLPSSAMIGAEELAGEKEKSLFESLAQLKPHVTSSLEKRDFQNALLNLAPLKTPVDAFFEGVMIMVDDENLRTQRLKLLMQVKELFDSVADFSKLQPNATN